jgi:tetratricopeptide (TPR) repeat protein
LISLGNASGAWAKYLAKSGRLPEAKPLFARADETLTRAIEINVADAEARWRRGLWRLEAGRSTEAIADFEAAIRIIAALEPGLRKYIERARRSPDF